MRGKPKHFPWKGASRELVLDGTCWPGKRMGARKHLREHSSSLFSMLGKTQSPGTISEWSHYFPVEEGQSQKSSDSFKWSLTNLGNRFVRGPPKPSEGGSVLQHQFLFCLNQAILRFVSAGQRAFSFKARILCL